MKILLAQLNTTVAAIAKNVAAIIKALERGRGQGADLVVFPELPLTGYPAKDLLERPYFIEANRKALEQVARATAPDASGRGIGAVVGFVDRNTTHPGQGLFNAAALLDSGAIVGVYHKCLLPTYDVFDEARYFDAASEARVLTFRGRRLGISICEDIWNDELHWSRRRYARDPIVEQSRQGAELLINISASPYTLGKRDAKHAMLAHTARRHGLPLVHVNLVGGNDELIFDGWSNVFDASGEIIAQCSDFEEDFVLVDLDSSGAGCRHPTTREPMERVHRGLTLGLRDYLHKCGFHDAVIGLSGGIDSAVVAALAVDALGAGHVRGIIMPSRFSSEGSRTDAEALARNLGIGFETISIEPMFQTVLEELSPRIGGRPWDVTEENIQSRLRGLTLMALSNKFGCLVLSTGNKSEVAVGYATLYGDMCGGLAPIADIPKTMIYDLARYLNALHAPAPWIPESTLTKPPSAELRPDQKDTDSLPPYDILDSIIHAYVERSLSPDSIIALGHDAETVRRVVRMIDGAEYKRRQAAPTLKITSRAFGYGWRMPLARGRDT